MLHASTYSGDNYPKIERSALAVGTSKGSVGTALDALDAQTSEQEKLIGELFGRLSSIIIPVPSPTSGGNCATSQSVCALQSCIDDQTDRVRTSNQRLSALIDSIQL